MDDAARDELSALRRRAYGPAADITEDPAALARLAELEDLARPAPPASAASAAPAASAGSAAPADSAAPAGAVATELETVAMPVAASVAAAPVAAALPAPRPRRRWTFAFAAAAAVAAIAAAAIVTPRPPSSSAPEPPAAAAEPIHVPVMIRDTTGAYVDLSWRPEAPTFPWTARWNGHSLSASTTGGRCGSGPPRTAAVISGACSSPAPPVRGRAVSTTARAAARTWPCRFRPDVSSSPIVPPG